MCVIAISRSGCRQPSEDEFYAMWKHNPDGAGYMFARSGRVIIHKGFMDLFEFLDAVECEHFTESDSVVYHFRISTQAGRTAAMTHPFPLNGDLAHCEALDLTCSAGIAHNGVIPLTSDRTESRYSDTALFIAHYLPKLIRNPADLADHRIVEIIESLCGWSAFAIMDHDGTVTTIGKFTEDDGILLSNRNHLAVPCVWPSLNKNYKAPSKNQK